MKILVLLAAAAIALGACSEGDSPPARASEAPPATTPAPSPPPTPTATPVPETACANQEAVVADVSLRTGEPASGDVDGDSADDSVSVYFDPQGEPGCQGFVVAESAGGTLAGPLETWREDFGLPMPTINSLAEVDDEPGAEVVVNMGVGASTQFVGLVTARDGALVQVVPEGLPDQSANGMFGFGGGVGHLEAVDCARFGGVIASFATPVGKRYRVERLYLTFEGTDLQFSHQEVERVLPGLIDRLPEYSASPFGSCASY